MSRKKKAACSKTCVCLLPAPKACLKWGFTHIHFTKDTGTIVREACAIDCKTVTLAIAHWYFNQPTVVISCGSGDNDTFYKYVWDGADWIKTEGAI